MAKAKTKRPKARLNFTEQFFPARPRQLLKLARSVAISPLKATRKIGLASAGNNNYLLWLKGESMLEAANRLATRYSGRSHMWRNPYARARPRAAINQASVWYAAYPNSLITKNGSSLIATLADKALWQAFQEVGIQGLHTGPMKAAGGIAGWQTTPSIDGHFDRISTRIDPLFGTEDEFRQLAKVAQSHGGIVIDDIVPGHTGKGPDFRLAEMNYGEYPGIYHMVEVDIQDWHLLPEVPPGKDSANLDHEQEEALKKAGYIIGRLPRVIFYEPGVKDTNWSATQAVKGIDGRVRRWVYLHYFKEGQPSINWLDPSFAGMKLVIGDALHSLGELGSKGLRLDANGFLGIEKINDELAAWSEGHPLSEAANMIIAGTVRKLGGFTFQELNLSMDDIKTMSVSGADLSYDFVGRPAYHHALATGDTELLRLVLTEAKGLGIDPASLVHALQNHDELTLELVHFWTVHKDDTYTFRGRKMKGSELRETVRKDMYAKLTGKYAPYNLKFTENGIACTTASFVAACLGYNKLEKLGKREIGRIQQAHLLLAMYNALQPGVFALSGWDLCGSLTVPHNEVEKLIDDGDTRWVNRGAYDLMGTSPAAKHSLAGLPRAQSLYGSLPEQLQDPSSFARQLQRILAVRSECGLATAHLEDIPPVAHSGVLVLVHRLAEDKLQATVLNFSAEKVSLPIQSGSFPKGKSVVDMFTGKKLGKVDANRGFVVNLEPTDGTSILIG
ncbi:MAG TPA: maltose alpha-D-glucosyltransferase [Candidatus Saccharimonadales bacterium]|nr:maltose alpha-D-glucosyltransferase [Candidatus Saccharimonadales bacterium]